MKLCNFGWSDICNYAKGTESLYNFGWYIYMKKGHNFFYIKNGLFSILIIIIDQIKPQRPNVAHTSLTIHLVIKQPLHLSFKNKWLVLMN